MPPNDPPIDANLPFASSEIPERFERIRLAVSQMPADEVTRQLPNLVESVRTYSADDASTIRFLIGISFSQNETLLDYCLFRLLGSDDIGRPRYETLKPAIHPEHIYLLLGYPPDRHFDSATLRGAILTALEEEVAREGSSEESSDAPTTASRSSLLRHLTRQFR